MTEHILSTNANGVLTLIMNRPDKKNALTEAMYGALADGIEAAQTDPTIRVVVLRGAGDMFTAGNDVAEFAAARPDDGPRHVARFIRAIAVAAKPLIAAVQGRAVGVGTTMLLHCDHVILAEGAQLTTPFVSLGLVPEAASSLLLPARIGHVRAFAMLALGEAVDARDAVAWGLANAVVPQEELETAIAAAAGRIARQPLGAVIATKALMRDTDTITTQMDVEGTEFLARLQSPEAKEAFMAFAQRRAPDFTQFS
jgi:enoyl-CoA hydratase/carnithine racemase